MFKIVLNSLEDTEKLAKSLASILDKKLLLTLNGNLAAGKTTFTKFLAKNLGIEDTVTSPTFNILKEYETDDIRLCHIDAYRLEGSDEELAFEDVFYEDTICLIEWAEYIEDFLPKDRMNIDIVLDGDVRNVTISSQGDFHNKIERDLEKLWFA